MIIWIIAFEIGMTNFDKILRNLQNPLKRFELVARTAKKEK